MAVIDHLVYAVPDLAASLDWFERATGVRPAPGGAHEGMGTHNALVSFGSCYLELIAPDPAQPDPAGPRPFGIDDLDQPALVGFAVRPSAGESIDELVATAGHRGYDAGEVVDMSRRAPHGDLLTWRLTFPTRRCLPFFIDWGTTPLPSTTAPSGVELRRFAVTVAEPDHAQVLDALGLEVAVATASTSTLSADVRGPGGDLLL